MILPSTSRMNAPPPTSSTPSRKCQVYPHLEGCNTSRVSSPGRSCPGINGDGCVLPMDMSEALSRELHIFHRQAVSRNGMVVQSGVLFLYRDLPQRPTASPMPVSRVYAGSPEGHMAEGDEPGKKWDQAFLSATMSLTPTSLHTRFRSSSRILSGGSPGEWPSADMTVGESLRLLIMSTNRLRT